MAGESEVSSGSPWLSGSLLCQKKGRLAVFFFLSSWLFPGHGRRWLLFGLKGGGHREKVIGFFRFFFS